MIYIKFIDTSGNELFMHHCDVVPQEGQIVRYDLGYYAQTEMLRDPAAYTRAYEQNGKRFKVVAIEHRLIVNGLGSSGQSHEAEIKVQEVQEDNQ